MEYKSVVNFDTVQMVNIEPTNICPLRCEHCGDDKTRPTGLMSPVLLEHIAKQCVNKEIRLFMSGEPLVHPGIIDLIGIAKKYTYKVVIHTNAVLLSETMSELIAGSGLSCLSISFDGLDKEEYEGIRRGANFEKVCENIRSFIRINKNKVYLKIQRIVKSGQPLLALDKLFPGANKYPVITRHSWNEKDKIEGHKPTEAYEYPCFFLWSYMAVLWDGRVVPCCADLNGKCIVGDAKKDTLAHIFNGNAMLSIRRRMLNKEPIPEICSGCERYFGKEKT